MILVHLTFHIICLHVADWSSHEVIRNAYDNLRNIYDLALVMHDLIGTIHVHIEMDARLLVDTITPS